MISCIYCVEKHVARAKAYHVEARSGYSGRVGMVLGELALAEEEALDAFPDLAITLRTLRKRIEQERAHSKVDWEDLLTQIEQLVALADPSTRKMAAADAAPAIIAAPAVVAGVIVDPSRGTTQAAGWSKLNIGFPPPVTKEGECTPCEKSKRYRDRMRIIDEEDKKDLAEHGHEGHTRRVVIIAVLSNFDPAYSIATCVQEQALALMEAGQRVTVLVSANAKREESILPAEIEVRAVLPIFPLKEDQAPEADVRAVQSVLSEELGVFSTANIIAHDLIFQSWNLVFATAIHAMAGLTAAGTNPGVHQWYHQCHSMPGNRRTDAGTLPMNARYALPLRHRLLALSAEQARRLVGYYALTDASRIDIVQNARDVRSFFGLSNEAASVYVAAQMSSADIVQVYPLSSTRLAAKGLDFLIRLFATFQKMGVSARLVIVNAHANGGTEKEVLAHYNAMADVEGLNTGTDRGLLFTSEILPETAASGLGGADVRSLMQLANLFVFPSVSEAGPLVLMEAAICGQMLVINNSLKSVESYVEHDRALWLNLDEHANVARLAEKIVSCLHASGKITTHIMRHSFSRGVMAKRLMAVLPVLVGPSLHDRRVAMEMAHVAGARAAAAARAAGMSGGA